jgi:type IV secretory pathway VirB10-like protein
MSGATIIPVQPNFGTNISKPVDVKVDEPTYNIKHMKTKEEETPDVSSNFQTYVIILFVMITIALIALIIWFFTRSDEKKQKDDENAKKEIDKIKSNEVAVLRQQHQDLSRDYETLKKKCDQLEAEKMIKAINLSEKAAESKAVEPKVESKVESKPTSQAEEEDQTNEETAEESEEKPTSDEDGEIIN